MEAKYYCSFIYGSYIKWIIVSTVLKWANHVTSCVSYLCGIRSCCVPFPGETWTYECMSDHSRLGISEQPKIHLHPNLPCWSSKSTGVTHRAGVTPAHPSIGNDSPGPHYFSPPHIHKQLQQGVSTHSRWLTAHVTPWRRLLSFPESLWASHLTPGGNGLFVWKETATFQSSYFTQVLLF